MSQCLVEMPIVSYVSVVLEADNMEEASDRGFEVASFCQYKTDGQEATLVIEELDPVEDLVESLANSKCSLEMAKVIEL